MGTDRDGLDSILAGNEEGAKGCCLSVDMTSDGIAVLSSDGYVLAPNGGAVAVCDHTYTELRKVAPRLLPVGQALDLARSLSVWDWWRRRVSPRPTPTCTSWAKCPRFPTTSQRS